MDSCNSDQEPVAGPCEVDNEISSSVKQENFLASRLTNSFSDYTVFMTEAVTNK